MQQLQKLVIDFADYPNVLMKMFNSCIKEPQRFVNADSEGTDNVIAATVAF